MKLRTVLMFIWTRVQPILALPQNFWYANLIEMFERLAFFGSRAAAVLYLPKTAAERGLGLGMDEKGFIFGIWAFIQCIVPMVSGGYSDRYGYRRSLAVAFTLNIIGYAAMANCSAIAAHLARQGWANPGFWVFLGAACCVAFGTAIFKPPISGTIAKVTTEETSSMGWGIFYWMVNIGGLFAPMGAAALRGVAFRWEYVFYGAAIVTALNFLPTFLLYREPERGHVDTTKGPFQVFFGSIATLMRDARLVLFLLIFSCFWLMFMQLWDTTPNFIDQWVDSRGVAKYFGGVTGAWLEADGQVKPEMILNLNAFSVIVFCLPVAWLIGRTNKVAVMVVGMVISLIGFVGAGATTLGGVCCLMIMFFTIGEVTCSPTFSAYIGLIAPADKKALYMGYSNIPFAIGWGVGNFIGGPLYERVADKFNLARQYLIDHLGMDAELVQNRDIIPNDRVVEVLARALDAPDSTQHVAALEGVIRQAHASVDWASIAQDQINAKAVEVLDPVLGAVGSLPTDRAVQVLWDTYHPYQVWLYLAIFGVVGIAGMIAFYLKTTRTHAGDVQEA